jgi:hypothetical protein
MPARQATGNARLPETARRPRRRCAAAGPAELAETRWLRAAPEFPPIGLRVIDVLELHNQGRTGMASSGKKKTTMAKLNRESRLRERRLDKQAKKDARKQASAHHPDPHSPTPTSNDESARGAGQPAHEWYGTSRDGPFFEATVIDAVPTQ